jgi:hypothetical protein
MGVMDRHKNMVNRDNIWKIKTTDSSGPLSVTRKLMLSGLFGETFDSIVSVGGHCHNPSPISLSSIKTRGGLL